MASTTDKANDIRIQSKGTDPYTIRITDGEGNPINGVRSVTWRCRYPGIPTFVIEGDGLDLDVGGELRASEADARLEEIREWLDRSIEFERANHALMTHGDLLLNVYENMRADFFGTD